MAEPVAASVGRELPAQAKAMSAAANKDLALVFSEDYYADRKPEYYVYIYNVSEQSWSSKTGNAISRPPTMPVINIEGKDKSEEYKLVAKIPSPMYTLLTAVDSGEMHRRPFDGRRFAMDIINPDNLGLDQNTKIDPDNNTSAGTNNLGDQGLFWSLNGPGAKEHGHLEAPTAEEIKSAVDRMENRYRLQLEKIDAIAQSNPSDLPNMVWPVHHRAAEYFGVERSWHMIQTKPQSCPNCSERIKAGIAFHKDSQNEICVISWERTVAAGKKTFAEAEAAGQDTSKWTLKKPAVKV